MRQPRQFAVAVALAWFIALSRASAVQQETPIREAAEPAALMQSDLNAELAEAAEAAPDDAAPVRQSLLLWFFRALGWRYTLMLPAVTFLSFVLLCFVVFYGRGWAAGAAAVLLVPLPLLVGLMGTIDGLMSSYMVIATSDVMPKPSEVAEGVSTALVTSMVGMCLMIPNYWLAVIGLLVRSMRNESEKR